MDPEKLWTGLTEHVSWICTNSMGIVSNGSIPDTNDSQSENPSDFTTKSYSSTTSIFVGNDFLSKRELFSTPDISLSTLLVKVWIFPGKTLVVELMDPRLNLGTYTPPKLGLLHKRVKEPSGDR